MKPKSQITNSQILKLGIKTNNMPPLYVIGKNTEKNELIVGTRQETMRQDFRIEKIDFRKEQPLWVRIRNLGELHEVSQLQDDMVSVKEPIFGVAEGQSAVFYDKNGVLVGASIIV